MASLAFSSFAGATAPIANFAGADRAVPDPHPGSFRGRFPWGPISACPMGPGHFSGADSAVPCARVIGAAATFSEARIEEPDSADPARSRDQRQTLPAGPWHPIRVTGVRTDSADALTPAACSVELSSQCLLSALSLSPAP